MSGIQFRRYELKHGAHDDFLAWYRQIIPVRERCGFELLFALDLREIGEFVSAWAYDGDLTVAEERYYASRERRRLGDLGHEWAVAHGGDLTAEELAEAPGFTLATHITSATKETGRGTLSRTPSEFVAGYLHVGTSPFRTAGPRRCGQR